MKLLRAATLSVLDPAATAQRYVDWFDYRIVESGFIEDELARSWGTPAMAGRCYVTAAPASGAAVYLRFIASAPVPEYKELRTFGWAAIEICVEDVQKVHEHLRSSPFDIIGPPREIDGLPAIYPMQVRGPDREIVYLTQIRADPPAYELPRAASFIDTLFILVLACSDMRASLRWFERCLKLSPGREMDIVYTMLSTSFGMPSNRLHSIATMTHERDVFLELDQYPSQATARPMLDGCLPPGIGIATVVHPQFEALEGPWIAAPAPRDGIVYGGAWAGTLRAPDGTLIEVVHTCKPA